MRKDKGLNGDLDRGPMLTWVMFLKFLDDMEQIREEEAKLNDLVTHPYSLDQINTAVDDLEHGRILGRGILTYP